MATPKINTRSPKESKRGGKPKMILKIILCKIINIHKNEQVVGIVEDNGVYYTEYYCERCGYLHFTDEPSHKYSFHDYFENMWQSGLGKAIKEVNKWKT